MFYHSGWTKAEGRWRNRSWWYKNRNWPLLILSLNNWLGLRILQHLKIEWFLFIWRIAPANQLRLNREKFLLSLGTGIKILSDVLNLGQYRFFAPCWSCIRLHDVSTILPKKFLCQLPVTLFNLTHLLNYSLLEAIWDLSKNFAWFSIKLSFGARKVFFEVAHPTLLHSKFILADLIWIKNFIFKYNHRLLIFVQRFNTTQIPRSDSWLFEYLHATLTCHLIDKIPAFLLLLLLFFDKLRIIPRWKLFLCGKFDLHLLLFHGIVL